MSVEQIDHNRLRVRENGVHTMGEGGLEVLVIVPCLNEHEIVGVCVQKAIAALTQSGLRGEVIVAENGSIDGSVEIAESFGARIVAVQPRGYGHALRGGIQVARGCYVIIEILRTDFLFIFPNILRVMRPIEHVVSRLHLGAQYQVLARKV